MCWLSKCFHDASNGLFHLSDWPLLQMHKCTQRISCVCPHQWSNICRAHGSNKCVLALKVPSHKPWITEQNRKLSFPSISVLWDSYLTIPSDLAWDYRNTAKRIINDKNSLIYNLIITVVMSPPLKAKKKNTCISSKRWEECYKEDALHYEAEQPW